MSENEKKVLNDSELDGVAGGVYGGVQLYSYRIVRGDTLSGIAYRFGTTVQYLSEINGIANPDFIRAGDTILVPHNR